MKKIANFFMKHKILTIISILVLAAAVSLTVVSIALWDTEEEDIVVPTIPVNPAEKYLEYYAMTPNANSVSGYDYYPVSRVPDVLVAAVEGYAVARYDGFATQVEIPSEASIIINKDDDATTLPVLHVLANYTSKVNNGLVSSTVDSVILPSTITYVEEGALEGLDVYVKGTYTYTYKDFSVSADSITVKDNSDNIVDILVKKVVDEVTYYYSTTSYDKFIVTDGKISYVSKYAGVKFSNNNGEYDSLEVSTTNSVARIYGLDEEVAEFENAEARLNTMTYSLDGADLFGRYSGHMISEGGNSYSRYIVVGSESVNLTIDGKTIPLEASAKYKVVYEVGNNPVAHKVTYKVNSVELSLDTDTTNYERYESSTALTLSANSVVSCYLDDVLDKEYQLSNIEDTYHFTFTPDVVYTDLNDVTNYSENDIYYLVKVVADTENVSLTVDKEDKNIIVYEATYADGVITGIPVYYYQAFVLPESDCSYYADFGSNGMLPLVYSNGLYLLNNTLGNNLRIVGYKNEQLVYETVDFTCQYGYQYDFTTTSGFVTSNYVVETKDIDTNENEFEVLFDSRFGLSDVDVVVEATYLDTHDNLHETPASETITKEVTNNKVTISKNDFTNNILMNAAIMSNEYIFTSYTIKVNGVVIYSYTEDHYSVVDFYQKQYYVSYMESSEILEKVYFDYSQISANNLVVSVNDNTITVSVTTYTYDNETEANEMYRNYTNIAKEEYYVKVSSSGWYAVSNTPNGAGIIASSYIEISNPGIVYYSSEGFKDKKYSIYGFDGGFITDMVYENGSAYALLPTYQEPYGYNVLDETGSVVATYSSTTGYTKYLYDYYLTDSSKNLLTAIPLLQQGNDYVANNVYLEADTYYVDEKSITIELDGYYDVKYDLSNLSFVSSTKLTNEYSIKIGSQTFGLYPTNNPNILVGYVNSKSDNNTVYLSEIGSDTDKLITTYKLPKSGDYKVYVNVSANIVPASCDWMDNRFNFIDINRHNTYKLIETPIDKTLKIVNHSIDSELSTDYKVTTKYDNYLVATQEGRKDILFHHLGDGNYVGLVNGYGKFNLDGKEFELTTAGSYQVYYDGLSFEVVRVEGAKRYSISFDNVTYHDMILNTANTNYEEYILPNYSLSSVVSVIYIKDDLGNVITHNIELSKGLYTGIYFAVDNQRRKENNYKVFTTVKGDLDKNAINIKLDNGSGNPIDYYVSQGEAALPDYEDVFTLEDYQSFVGWYTDSTFETLYDGAGLTEGTYYALVKDGQKYIYVTTDPNVTIKDTLGNEVTRFEYVKDVVISFTVETTKTIKEVSVGSKVLTADNNVYSFNANDIAKGATINVALLNDVVTVTLMDSEHSNVIATHDYEVGSYVSFGKPTGTNFLYYYDRQTGIVYTDKTGRLLSPYMITKDITLTAVFTNKYYLTVNKDNGDGTFTTLSSQEATVGSLVVNQFPRESNKHYEAIDAYATTSGYPIEYKINEYLNSYSFVMPEANVIINIKYKDNNISPSSPKGVYDDLYVLVPEAMVADGNVLIYDSTLDEYISMTRLADLNQVYPNYIVFRTNIIDEDSTFDLGNSEFKIKIGDYESYVYTLAYADNEFINDTFIIENLGLENEVCYVSDWIKYEKNQNVYTFDREIEEVKAIHGEVILGSDKKTVTVKTGITIATHNNYQYATFEIIYKNNDVKMTYIINYTAYGTEENPILIDSDTTFNEFIGNTKYRYSKGLVFVQTDNITVEDSKGYTVIYNQEKTFNHTYDGKGYILTYIQTSIRDNVNNGLFGYIGLDGVVKNVNLSYTLIDSNHTNGYETKHYLGSIASVNLGEISNVTTKGPEIEGNNIRYVGGIVSINVGVMTNCINNISIALYNHGPAESRLLGGITAYNGGTIINCVDNGVITLGGNTGQEKYVNSIVAMNRGTVSQSYYNQYGVDPSGTYKLLINGKYHYVYKSPESDNIYISLVMKLNAGDVIEILKDGTLVNDLTLNANSDTGEVVDGRVTIGADGYYDLSYTTTTKKLWIEGSTEYILINDKAYPLFENVNTSGEYTAFALYLNAGDVLQFYKDKTLVNIKRNSSSVAGSYTEVVNKSITINTTNTYDVYLKTNNEVYIGLSEKGVQQLEAQTFKAVVVDDWFFIKEAKSTLYDTYYFESAMYVTYYDDSDNELGSMLYNGAQTYDHNGMDSVVIDILKGATKVEISRMMFISNRSAGHNMWYYNYDGTDYHKIGNSYTSRPEVTYRTGKISIDSIISRDSDERIIYIYAESSNMKYATSNAGTQVGTIIGELPISSYVEVSYAGDYSLDSFRIKYFDHELLTENDENNPIAVISYEEGDQIKFLSGAVGLLFESIEEGTGIRRIGTAEQIEGKTAIEITLTDYSSGNENQKSNYSLSVNGSSRNLYVNTQSTSGEEAMATSVSLKAGDVIRILNSESQDVNAILNDYSTDTVTQNGDKDVIISNDGLYDIYYTVNKNSIYIDEALVYEVVLFNSNQQIVNTYKMYRNPNGIHDNEVMAIGVNVLSGYTAKIRIAGDLNYLTDFGISGDSATVNGGVISFNQARGHDFFLYIVDNYITVHVSNGTVDNFEISYPEVEVKSLIDLPTAGLQTLEFVNSINKYNIDGEYGTRVYYLDENGQYILDGSGNVYKYDFQTAENNIPIHADAKMLKIVRYKHNSNIEMYEVVVNSIYFGKKLTLSNPYYGYYDASYSSQVTNQEGLYLENTLLASSAYVNYVLNDGRTGRIKMELNEGKFYVPFDSVIGLNPEMISFTCDLVTTEYMLLQDVFGNKLYSIDSDTHQLSSVEYSTFTTVKLYVDITLPRWDGYYIYANGVYYEANKSQRVTIGSTTYDLYAAYVKGSSYQVTSNPNYTSVFKSTVFTETDITMVNNSNGFDFQTIAGAQKAIYEYEFTAKVIKGLGPVDLGTMTWNVSGTETGSPSSNDATKGQQLGTASQPFKELILTSTTVSGVTKVTVNTSGATSIKATLDVYVGDVKIGNTIELTIDATVYEFVSATPLTGEVKLHYTQTSSKAIYIKYIGVDYEVVQSDILESYNYEYYLESDTPGLLPTIGLIPNGDAFFGFYDLSEEVSYYVVKEKGSNKPLSDIFTTSAGRHVIIYYENTNYYYEHTFDDSNNLFDYGEVTIDDVDWVVEGKSSMTPEYDKNYGCKFGKGEDPEYNLILTSEFFTDVEKVVINTRGAASATVKLSVYVGDSLIGETNVSSTLEAHTFTSAEPLNGRIRIVYEQVANAKAGAIYIKSIQINPELSDVELADYAFQYTFTKEHGFAFDEASGSPYTSTQTLNGISWTLTADNYRIYNVHSTKGVQLGTSTIPNTYVNFATTYVVEDVEKLIINTSGADETDCLLVVKVNGAIVGRAILTAAATEYTFVLEEKMSGIVEFEYTQTTNTAIYIHSVYINPRVRVANVYRNETVYTVNAFYNGYKDRTIYKFKDIVLSPATPSISDTAKYSFEFIGWSLNGQTYSVEAGTKRLYQMINSEKVYLYAVSDMTLTPVYQEVIKKFTITLYENDGTVITLDKPLQYDYGQKISSDDIKVESTKPTTDNNKSWFDGWYIDSDKIVKASDYPIIQDTDLYAKWFADTVFLVGSIEGLEIWHDQRTDLQAEIVTVSQGKKAQVENVYLNAGDKVKLYEFISNNEGYWYESWANYPGDKASVDGDKNLVINKSGYYSFYINWWEGYKEYNSSDPKNSKHTANIYVTYQGYIVYFEFDKDDLVSENQHNFPNYRFDLPYSGNFPLISVEDKRLNNSLTVNTPELQYTDANGTIYVNKGWYTRPVNGERVTDVTAEMLKYKNSITLYPHFVIKGFYLAGQSTETYLAMGSSTNLNTLPEYNAGDSITINYYNGSAHSANGSTPLANATVVNESNVTISGNTITFNADGLYDIYQDDEGKLHIVQYHKVKYIFTANRLTAEFTNSVTVELYGSNISSNTEYIQKYNEPLAMISSSNVPSNVKVLGWTIGGTNVKPTNDNQKVTGNYTYEIVYRMN